MRNCAKKASGASTPEYDGKFGMKSSNGLGGGDQGWRLPRQGQFGTECGTLLHESAKDIALAGVQ